MGLGVIDNLDDYFKAAKAAAGKVDDVVEGAGDVAKTARRWFGRGTDATEAARAADREALAVIRSGENLAPQQTVRGAVNAYKRDRNIANRVKKQEAKAVNPNWWQAASRGQKAAVIAALPAAGIGATIYSAFTGNDTPSYDLSKLNFPKPGVVSPEQALLDAEYQAARTEAIRKAYGYTSTVPGSEIYDPISGVTNQLGAASVLSMQDIANQYAQSAAATQARGAQAGQSINDIYGQGASALEVLGAQPSSEYDAMIPVSGEAAVAPGQQRMAGQNLSNYLTQNQLINSQAQGGMAELANMLGPAYANQYALMDKQFRMEADANKTRMDAEYANERAMNLADALANAQMMDDQRKYERESAALALGSSGLPNPAVINRYVAEWESMPKQDREYYKAKAKVTDVESWIMYKYNEELGLTQQQGA